VRETAGWVEREMTSPEGAFWSAIDAETHGHEGAYYVWTREELQEALGEEDFAFLAPLLGFEGRPFFEGSHYVLHVPAPVPELAGRRKMAEDDLLRDLDAGKARLLAARDKRERPATDDKILADWNGMLITGLAVAGEVLGERSYVDRAARAAEFVLTAMRPAGGPLLHAWRKGQGKIPAQLGDYVFMIRGLLALHKASGEERWLRAAVELTEEQIQRLRDPQGGFFMAGESPDVLFRSKDVFDGATPSSNAIAVLNLIDLAKRTGDWNYRVGARASLCAFAQVIETHPDAVRMLCVAVREYHQTETGRIPEETRVAGEPMEERAARERSAEAAGVGKLVHEAEGVVRARLETAEPGADGWRAFRLTLEVAPGWHLQANPASEGYLVPTEVKGEVRNVRYPEGTPFKPGFAREPISVYEGTVEIAGEARGERIAVGYQVCDEGRCLPPVEKDLTP
jgi:uncharacterized protein